jgi:hypothetical protein
LRGSGARRWLARLQRTRSRAPAIISTAARARHAKQRAAVRRNELRRYPQGRKKKWLIPRWWRLKLSDAEQARVLAHMAAYDARVRGGEPRPPWQPSASIAKEARSLESCERALILAMNRPDPPSAKIIEQVYANVREIEGVIGDAGSAARLARLRWEIERFRYRALHPGTGLADNVSQGNANGQQFRTAPLWGVGQRLFFLHDGRTNNLVTAITQHASSGSEANQVIQNFKQLSTTNQQALVNFLRSL